MRTVCAVNEAHISVAVHIFALDRIFKTVYANRLLDFRSFFFSLAVLLHTNLFLFSFVRIFLHTNFVVLPSKTYIFSIVPETQRNEKEWMQFGFFNLFGCYALVRENFPHEKWSLIVDISAFRCGIKSKRGAQHTERLSQIHTKTHTNWTRKKKWLWSWRTTTANRKKGKSHSFLIFANDVP